jgi:hypothetical protein
LFLSFAGLLLLNEPLSPFIFIGDWCRLTSKLPSPKTGLWGPTRPDLQSGLENLPAELTYLADQPNNAAAPPGSAFSINLRTHHFTLLAGIQEAKQKIWKL